VDVRAGIGTRRIINCVHMVEFGQRFRRNPMNPDCPWSNWDKTCH
jgi:hypothetical protein